MSGPTVGRRTWCTGIAIVSMTLICLAAQAATIIVGPSPAPYQKIQDGIDNAVSGQDTVLVQPKPGDYHERISFKGKAITVTSADIQNPAAVVIDGDAGGHVVIFTHGEGSTSVLQGVTIKNGKSGNGGGVYCSGSSPTLTNNIISGNSSNVVCSGGGGGVYCGYSSSPTLTNNTISGNSTTAMGGGVCCYENSSPTLSNNTISGNQARLGGGVYSWFSSSPALTNNLISSNSASTGGGGGYCGASTTLTNNIIIGNSAPSAGGVYCGDSAALSNNRISGNSAGSAGGVSCNDSATLTSNKISGNSATYSGGGVECGASATLTNNLIIGNSAGSGGGVICGGSATLTSNKISVNSASTGGGVCCAGSSSAALTNNMISSNSATQWGGGVYCYNHSSPTLTNNSITNNSAVDEGGGVYSGGTTSLLAAWPTLTNNRISGNSATEGGGVFCTAPSSSFSPAPTLTNNTISVNSATTGGGVFCATCSPALTNNTLSGNSATTYGGGVYCSGSSPTLRNTIVAFSTNVGLYAAPPSSPVVTYCDFWNNTAGNYVGVTPGIGCISADPLFANAHHFDFGLMSQAGRWNGSAWVADAVTSPGIDAGAPYLASDPTSFFGNEPAPNGGRINLGYDGNTATASKSAPQVAYYQPQGKQISAQSPYICVGFTVPMECNSTQGAFSLTKYGTTTTVPGTFTWDRNEMDYAISTALAPSTTYTVTIGTGATSAAGVTLAAPFAWNFKTDDRPAIASIFPVGANVPTSSVVKIGFNMTMNASVTQAAFRLCQTGTGTALRGDFSSPGKNVMQFTPIPGALRSGTQYTVTLAATAQGANGQTMAAAYSWNFQTGEHRSPQPAMLTAAATPTAQGAEIVVNLAAAAEVTVTIRNLAGRPVALLMPRPMDAGTHRLSWNGLSSRGTKVPGGTYLVEVATHAADGGKARVLAPLRLGR